MCAVSSGIYQDWMFIDVEDWNNDPINGNTNGWTQFRGENIAINMVTLEKRRLCHHRSRGFPADYYNQPRISCSADGTKVIWMSNYNVGNEKCDTYGIFCPLG